MDIFCCRKYLIRSNTHWIILPQFVKRLYISFIFKLHAPGHILNVHIFIPSAYGVQFYLNLICSSPLVNFFEFQITIWNRLYWLLRIFHPPCWEIFFRWFLKGSQLISFGFISQKKFFCFQITTWNRLFWLIFFLQFIWVVVVVVDCRWWVLVNGTRLTH